MKSKLLTIISMSLLFTGMSFAAPQGTMKDPRDGQTYKTVKIGKQVWMAENMNYDIKHSYCYDDDLENCQKYGRLYTWAAANYVCPEGWHLPTKEEFETLMSNVGGIETAGKMLKSKQGWDPYEHEFEHALQDGNGIDKYGFNVLPAGYRSSNGDFSIAGKYAHFWSATEDNEDIAYDLSLSYIGEGAGLLSNSKSHAFSVRCLRGSVPQKNEITSQKGTMKDTEIMKDTRDGQTYKTVKIGRQVWMAENMNYDIKHSYCYDDDPANCEKYGRLYTWAAANYVCPEGWHLPTKEEFETLMSNVGGIETAGKMLKSRTGWEDYEGKSGNGIDKYGFNVLPAGGRNPNGYFYGARAFAFFWSATDYGLNGAYYLSLLNDLEIAHLGTSSEDDAVSVRCLRGSN